MQSTPRALPFVLVGALVLLLAGGIVLSLSSAPPLAQQQLQNAATATMSASSFAIVDTNSVTSADTSPSARAHQNASARFLVLYQAPDAIEETEQGPQGQTASVILIGARRFRGTNSQWIELPPSKGLGARAVTTIMSPLLAATTATSVTRHGEVYGFVPRHLATLLTTVLAVNAPQLSSPRLTAVVHDGLLTREKVTAVVAHQRLAVDLVFSSIGSAPPVTVPPTVPGRGATSGAPSAP